MVALVHHTSPSPLEHLLCFQRNTAAKFAPEAFARMYGALSRLLSVLFPLISFVSSQSGRNCVATVIERAHLAGFMNSNTSMLGHHVSSIHFAPHPFQNNLSLSIPFANKVILGQDVIGAGVAYRILHQGFCRLTISPKDNDRPHHLIGSEFPPFILNCSCPKKLVSCAAIANARYSVSHELKVSFPTNFDCQLVAPPACEIYAAT